MTGPPVRSAKFWLSVLTDLKQRGVDDLLITCVNGLKGFDTAIASVFPTTAVQLCIVHQLQNSFRFVPDKLLKDLANDLKTVYQAPNREQGLEKLVLVQENGVQLIPKRSNLGWKSGNCCRRFSITHPPSAK
ncbi:hypothetical protein GCM10028808_48060 [Spirosoma migulaei]